MFFRMAMISAIALILSIAPDVRSQTDDGRIRDELQKVFAQPEFKSETKVREDNAFLRALRVIFTWLVELRGAAPVLFWLVLIGCIGLLLALIIRLGVVIRRAAYVRQLGNDESADDAHRKHLSAGLRIEAEEHARAGDYTAAVRCLFLSLIYAFDESGNLLFKPALTNREYLRGFVDRPTLQDGLRLFVDVLDDNWYGQSPSTDRQYQECMSLYHRLRTQA